MNGTRPDMTGTDRALTPGILLEAYAAGIFPMSESRDDPGIFWVDPARRGVLPLGGFHISRSLARRMRRGGYTVTLDHDFAGVVDACANRSETWINAEIRRLYVALHGMGHAHSLEVWSGDTLAGAVYGVALAGAFFGESMVSPRTDGSKLALAHLVDHLRRCGFVLFDTQFLTRHLETLGAVEITRAEYRSCLAEALQAPADIRRYPLDPDPVAVLHRNTQTS